MKLILIASYATFAEAKAAEILLTQYNIKSFLQEAVGFGFSGEGTTAGPHNLLIPEEKFKEAQEILGII